jgi:hypothetical protein
MDIHQARAESSQEKINTKMDGKIDANEEIMDKLKPR